MLFRQLESGLAAAAGQVPQCGITVATSLSTPQMFCSFVNEIGHNLQINVIEFVSQDTYMWYECVTCPMTHAAIATPRAFATAGGTLHHCANLSVAAFAVRSNVWAARCCSQHPCWLALSPRRAGQACAALVAEGAVTVATARSLWAAQLPLPNCRSHIARAFVGCVWADECLHDMWLVALGLPLVGWRLHSKAGFLTLVGYWSLAF